MKKINFRYYIAALLITWAGVSCQKVIDLKLRSDTGKLVIEGNICDTAGLQIIRLSRNVPFTNANTYPPVSGAVVTVADTLGNAYQFNEGPPGIYTNTSFAGVHGAAYTMTVKTTDGNTYTASSRMPLLVGLRDVIAQNDNIGNNQNRRKILVRFQDPPGVPNQYRFILTVNGVHVNEIFAFNDQFFDGRFVSLELLQNDAAIYPGDRVTVEMQCLDLPVYTYWFTLMQQSEGPGGGVTPSNPPTNIMPATLGYFSAHTSQQMTIVVR